MSLRDTIASLLGQAIDLAEVIASTLEEQPSTTPSLHSVYSNPRLTPDQRRALRDDSLPYEWTPTFRRWLAAAYNHQCAYCGRRDCKFHVDHIIPVSWPKCPGATIDNAVWVCASCNTDRGNEPLLAWLSRTFGRTKAERIFGHVNEVRAAALVRFAGQRLLMRAEGKRLTARRKAKAFPKGTRYA